MVLMMMHSRMPLHNNKATDISLKALVDCTTRVGAPLFANAKFTAGYSTE